MGKTKRKPPPPRKPGIGTQHLHAHFSTIPRENVKNGHVLFLFVQNSRLVSSTIRALARHVPGASTSPNLVQPLIKKFESFNHLSRENEKARFVEFCEEPFTAWQQPERPTSESENTSTAETPTKCQLQLVQIQGPVQVLPAEFREENN